MNSVISVCLMALFLSGLSAQQPSEDPCSRFGFTNVQPFFPKRLIGTWYLYATNDEGLPQENNDCIQFIHGIGKPGIIETTENSKNLDTDELITGNSKMAFNWPSEGRYVYLNEEDNISQDTQIIAAKYDRFYIEFSCKDGYMGIFTRSREPSSNTVNDIDEIIAEHNFDKTVLRYVNQDLSTCS